MRERGVDLAAAFDGLLVELVGTAFGAIKGGLEAVADVEEQVDGADGVGVAVMRSRSPAASKCTTAVPAGKTRQSTE